MSRKLSLTFLTALTLIACLLSSQLPMYACATCGCSEICPIAAMDANSSERDPSLLSNSIWGNIILKMAYARDPEINRLAKKLKITNNFTTAGLATVAGGTAAQGIVGMSTLNPSDGLPDSYAPGIVGVVLEVGIIGVLGGGPLVHHKFRKQLKARQLAIREQVEKILHHLEYSKTNCEESQKELTTLIGERGARECIQLWQSSHQLASLAPATNTI